MRIDVTPLDTGEPPTRSGAQPLTVAHEQRCWPWADRHVGSAGALIRAQEDRLGTLGCKGHDALRATFLLGIYARPSDDGPAHRQLIVKQIERLRRRRQRSERVDHRRSSRCIRLSAADPCLLDSRFIAYKGLTSRTSLGKFSAGGFRRPPCCSRHSPKNGRTRGNAVQSRNPMPPHPTVLRPDGRLADHYIDANGALDKVRDGASPGRSTPLRSTAWAWFQRALTSRREALLSRPARKATPIR